MPQAAVVHGVSAWTARKWLGRYLALGEAGLGAFSAMHTHERTPSEARFLRDAVAYYVRLGAFVQRLLTDNGSAFRSRDFAAACKELGVRHRFTRPYCPQTNGKAECFIQSAKREWTYGFTLQHSSEGTNALDRWNHHDNQAPPASRHRRCRPHVQTQLV